MNKEYKDYFNSIVPATGDSEFLDRVLRKAEAMENNKKRINFKKPLIAACAAVVALGVGVSAAAATGLIDFDKFFNNIFTADNEMGSTLVANVDDIYIEISDNDYDLNLNAIIGDGKNMFGSFEIVRKDGTPVTDHLMNSVAPTGMRAVEEWCGLLANNSSDKLNKVRPTLDSGKIHYSINDAGNIDVHFEVEAVYELNEIPVVVTFQNLYCIDENGSTYPVFPVDAWIDFTYTPTPNAQVTKNVVITENNKNKLNLLKASDGGTLHPELIDGSIGCMSAIFNVQYTDAFAAKRTLSHREDCDIKLIKSDGTEIAINFKQMTAMSSKETNGTIVNDMTFKLFFMTEDNVRTAFDITEISAISIDGIVFDLV